MIAVGDDRNERWHDHDTTRWWSFELAVMKSLLVVSKLPGVYCEETQIMNCYLFMIANYANVTYNHKYYVVNAWAIVSGFWFHSNLSSSLKSEFVTQIWGKSSASSKLHQRVGSCSCHLSFLSSPSAITKLSPTIRHLNYYIKFILYLSL